MQNPFSQQPEEQYMQQPQQPQEETAKQEVYAGIWQQHSDDLIKWILEPDMKAEEVAYEIAGFEMNEDAEWVIPGKDPENLLMNERGARFLKSLIKSFMRKEILLAYLEKDQASKMAESFMATVIINLHMNKHKFQTDALDIDLMREELSNLMEAILSGAVKGTFMDFLKKTTSREERFVNQENKKKPNLFSMFGR